MAQDSKTESHDSTSLPEVRRVGIKELIVYDVSDDQLGNLRQNCQNCGGTGSDQICLILAIFLLTIFGSYLSILLTEDIEFGTGLVVYVVITVVSAIVGTVLLILWLKAWVTTRGKASAFVGEWVKEIRNRLPEGDQETDQDTETSV